MPDVLVLAKLLSGVPFLVAVLLGIYSLIKIPNRDDRFHYAGFWMRVIAGTLDGIIVMVASLALAIPAGLILDLAFASILHPQDLILVSSLTGSMIGLLVGWHYFALLESSRHCATPGKKLLGLKVVDLQGQPISFRQASGRYFAKILSMIPMSFGFYMIGWTRRKQGLHDKLAGCLVVRGSAGAAKGSAAAAPIRAANPHADRAALDYALSRQSKPSATPAIKSRGTGKLSASILARLDAGNNRAG